MRAASVSTLRCVIRCKEAYKLGVNKLAMSYSWPPHPAAQHIALVFTAERTIVSYEDRTILTRAQSIPLRGTIVPKAEVQALKLAILPVS
jgi:hypothetical protein